MRYYSLGPAAGRNGNNRWDWEGNANKSWLSLGAGIGMAMNSCERDEMELKKTLSIISRPKFISWPFIN